MKSTKKIILLAVSSLLVTLIPAVASADPADTLPGIFVKETIHELPAPDVAMASDGRSLIVWQDAQDPQSVTCDANGGDCSVLGAIVEADGQTIGEPFLISGEVVADYYFAASYVIWNEDLSEWLVLMTSYTNGFDGVYAQRVSSAGELVGDLVTLPTFYATPRLDRSVEAVVALPANEDRVQATATWSSIDQAYLVTFLGRGDNSELGLNNNQSLFGYLMNGDLSSYDGINAVFPLQDTTVRATNALVKQEYSPELDQWAVIWMNDSIRKQVRLSTVSAASQVITTSASSVVFDGTESGFNYYDVMPGDIIWVNPINSWVVSWGGRPTIEENWNAYARTVSPQGDLGNPANVSNFGLSANGEVIEYMYSHHMAFDSTSGTIYATGHIQEPNVDFQYLYNAALWKFEAATFEPIEWFELKASRIVQEQVSINSSSRPRITINNGGIAVVFQNWPVDTYLEPTEVRYYLVNSTGQQPTSPTIANGYRADALGSVYFAPGSSKLSKAAQDQLKALVTANPTAIYKVTGYVQKSGTSVNDAKLSLARAKSVESYLASLGAGVTFNVVVDTGLVPAKEGTSAKARKATLFAMTPVVQ